MSLSVSAGQNARAGLFASESLSAFPVGRETCRGAPEPLRQVRPIRSFGRVPLTSETRLIRPGYSSDSALSIAPSPQIHRSLRLLVVIPPQGNDGDGPYCSPAVMGRDQRAGKEKTPAALHAVKEPHSTYLYTA